MLKAALCLAAMSLSIGSAANAEESWGCIDRQGNWLLPPHYHAKQDVINARAWRAKKPSTAVTDRVADNSSMATRDSADKKHTRGPVANDKLSNLQPKSDPLEIKPKLILGKDGGWQYCAKDGKPLIDTLFKYATPFQNNGTAFVKRAIGAPLELIGTDGRTLQKLDSRIKTIGHWSEGFAPVNCAPQRSGDVLDGYIDNAGTIVVEPQFSWGGDFKEGLAPVLIDQHWFYINRSGEKMITLPDNVSCALPFQNGLAFIAVGGVAFEHEYFNQRHGARWGIIDRHGKLIVEPQFIAPGNFFEGFDFADGLAPACVRVGSSNRYGFIDERGHMVITPQFIHASKFIDGVAAVSVGDSSFSSEEFKNRRERVDLVKTFFEEFKVIGMERKRVHDLLGTPAKNIDTFASYFSNGKTDSIAASATPDKDSYSVNSSTCGNALRWLEIDYRQGRVRRYRYNSGHGVGGWTYDGRPPELELEYVDTPREEINPDLGVVGLQETFDGKKVSVERVTPGLPAALAGILKGDEIMSIDGKGVDGEWYNTLYKRLVGPPGSSVIIRIKRDGELKEISIRRMWIGDIPDLRTRCEFLRGID